MKSGSSHSFLKDKTELRAHRPRRPRHSCARLRSSLGYLGTCDSGCFTSAFGLSSQRPGPGVESKVGKEHHCRCHSHCSSQLHNPSHRTCGRPLPASCCSLPSHHPRASRFVLQPALGTFARVRQNTESSVSYHIETWSFFYMVSCINLRSSQENSATLNIQHPPLLNCSNHKRQLREIHWHPA